MKREIVFKMERPGLVEEGQVVAKVNRSATKDCLLNAASR